MSARKGLNEGLNQPKIIRAAIIGLGWWGENIIRRLSGSSIVRICLAVDVFPDRHRVAEAFGIAFAGELRIALADPDIDIVILATPHSLHPEQIEQTARAGKHVFCEKPLALETADAVRSIDLCKRANVRLGIGHERRFESAMMDLRAMIDSGELGTLMHVEANFSHDKLANVQKGNWRDAPNVAMTGTGIHLTDAFINLFGAIKEVNATITGRAAFSENGDVASVQVIFASGMTGYLSAILATPLYMRFAVFGRNAWVEIRNDTHPDTSGAAQMVISHSDGRKENRTYEWHDTVKENIEMFARSLSGEVEYPFTDEQKIGNVAVLAAVHRSALSGAPATVDWGNWSVTTGS